MEKAVLIIATLDTKGLEVKYIKERLNDHGLKTIVVDSGIRGEPQGLEPDVRRDEVARAGGKKIEDLIPLVRGLAVTHMAEGLRVLVLRMYRNGRFDGVICIGGLEGSILGSSAMQTLPLGVPKLLVTPMASGSFQFGPFVGERDIMILHSVTDILGVNPLSRAIFDNAVNAVAGMVQGSRMPIRWGREKMIAVTLMGNTTPAIMFAKKLFEDAGYSLVIFHANGTGGRSMETLVDEGVFTAVLDFTPHEITDFIAGGGCSAGPDRLDAACRRGVPQVIVPGGMDFIVQGKEEEIEARFRGRPYYVHNPVAMLVRTSGEEMERTGEFIARKLNTAKGPVAVVIPTRGFSMYCHPGEPLHDPPSDSRLIESLKRRLAPEIRYEEMDAHINDEVFARRVFEVTLETLGKAGWK